MQKGMYIMKYYSEALDKLFDSEEDLTKAEAEKKAEEVKKNEVVSKQKAEKRAEAQVVEDALTKAHDAYKEADRLQHDANEKLSNWCKKYGYFHISSNSTDDFFTPFENLNDFFERLFRF